MFFFTFSLEFFIIYFTLKSKIPPQCGGIPGLHPAHCSSLTSTPGMNFLHFRGLPLLIFLLFIQGKQFVNQNDVEFGFSIGHALVLFPFF